MAASGRYGKVTIPNGGLKMNHNIIREVEALYNLNRDFLSGAGLEEKHQNPGLHQAEYRNTFLKDPDRYLNKDQLMGLFKDL